MMVDDQIDHLKRCHLPTILTHQGCISKITFIFRQRNILAMPCKDIFNANFAVVYIKALCIHMENGELHSLEQIRWTKK